MTTPRYSGYRRAFFAVLQERQAMSLPPPHTLAQVAALIGRNAGALSQNVNGHRITPPALARQLCRGLGCSSNQLFHSATSDPATPKPLTRKVDRPVRGTPITHPAVPRRPARRAGTGGLG